MADSRRCRNLSRHSAIEFSDSTPEADSWINVYNYGLHDRTLGQIPVVGQITGAFFGLLGTPFGLSGGDVAVNLGNQVGPESGAINQDVDGLNHENVDRFLDAALELADQNGVDLGGAILK